MMKFNLNKAHKNSNLINSCFELNVNFELQTGDFLSIYGDSGAGKTTILRLIAGLDEMQNGNIKINDTIWYDSTIKVNLTPQQRSIGFVFQNNSLFPNMTVLENLKFALKNGESTNFLNELITSFDLNELVSRDINSLSGGQKQKVALARAIIQKPSILLLDEPLSALDDRNRQLLQDLLLKVHHQFGLTTILVSHNISEIYKLSNKVLNLKLGKLEKFGTPKEIFIPNSNSNQITLIGTVLDLTNSNGEYALSIQSNNGTLKQVVSENDFNNYSVGELIEVSISDYKSTVKKVDDF